VLNTGPKVNHRWAFSFFVSPAVEKHQENPKIKRTSISFLVCLVLNFFFPIFCFRNNNKKKKKKNVNVVHTLGSHVLWQVYLHTRMGEKEKKRHK
jgi:hypothetical protein